MSLAYDVTQSICLFEKEVTNEEPHNLYTKDEKTVNATIVSLVLSLVSCMSDTGMHVFSAEG